MRKVGKILIIGGNAAGCAAAAKAKRVSPDSEVILFERSGVISTGTCELPYLLSNEVTDSKSLVFYDEGTFERSKGVKVKARHEVVGIDRKKKSISVKNLQTLSTETFVYDSLIISSGSVSRKDGILADSTFENLFTLKTVGDADTILTYFSQKRISQAVIIGAGYIAVEIADALHKRGISSTLIDREQRIFPFAGKEISSLVTALLTDKSVGCLNSVSDFKLIRDNNRITGVRVGSRTIDADVVFNCTGFIPNVALASTAKLELGRNGGIKVSSKMHTSDPSIFAAGDCVEYKELITGQNIFLPQATLAHLSGHTAGANAAGGNEFMQPALRNISVRVIDKYFIHVGLTETELAPIAYRMVPISVVHSNLVKVMPGSASNFSKIVCDKFSGKIVSASFLGGTEVSGFADLVASFIQLGQPASALAKIAFNYTPSLSNFVHPLSLLGRKAEKLFSR